MPVTAQSTLSFERSVHEGAISGTGSVVGVEYVDVQSATATLTFSSGTFDRAWDNNSVKSPAVNLNGQSGSTSDPLGQGSVRMYTTQQDALVMVFQEGSRAVQWNLESSSGALEKTAASRPELQDRNPVLRDGARPTIDLSQTSTWIAQAETHTTLRGDFMISLHGWNLKFDDDRSYTVGTETTENEAIEVRTASSAWLTVQNATLVLDVYDASVANNFVQSPTLTTDGTMTLVGLLGEEKEYVGLTTLAVDSTGDHLDATLTKGDASSDASTSSTSIFVPRGAGWLWGGAGASLLIAAFIVMALMTRSIPMLEWRSYHALDEHRPLRAATWARFWTRRDPWDGHAWAARGESHLMMGHDRRAAQHFTQAHQLLPVDERAINALHAARAHARGGRASEAAHWIGIVASLDLTVLLTAREEPDFARVWNDDAMQKTVQQVLGIGA